MSVFGFSAYKPYLREQIDRRKRPGLMTELAQASGCDRTYLSQVLSDKAHLTADHAVNLSAYFELTEAEGEFFLTLVLLDRSGNAQARRRLKAKLEKMRTLNLNHKRNHAPTTEHVNLSESDLIRFFTAWQYQAAVILVNIPRLQKRAELLPLLGVPPPVGDRILQDLLRMGMLVRRGDRYLGAGRNALIPDGSPLAAQNHVNWRLHALEHIRQETGFHFSAPVSISGEDALTMKREMLEYIDRQAKRVHVSKKEEVHVFCCDLYPIS